MKAYGIADAKSIIRHFGQNLFEVRADGVFLLEEVLQYDPSQQLHWKYVCELDGPLAPNPLTAPCLPFPFTAHQLAAFMLDGVVAVIASVYGDWEGGPDQEMLDDMGVLAREPKQALRNAYLAFAEAQGTVGYYPLALQIKADRLRKIYSYRNGKANKREGVFAEGITPDEYRATRERATASNRELSARMDSAKNEYHSAFEKWRGAMVKHLLQTTAVQNTAAHGSKDVAGLAEVDSAGSVVKAAVQSNSTKTPRSDSIDPVIRLAQSKCNDPEDTNQVWAQMEVFADNEHAPFLASTKNGLKYRKHGEDAYFTRDALNKRLHPEKRKSPAKRP